MEVREGYKQTEVGLIPEDWNIKKIAEVCRLINGRGFKPYEWKSDGLPIIRIQNLNGSDDFNYYQGGYDKKIEIEDGQLLFAWSGSRGTSFGPHIWSGSLGLLNYHTWKIVIKENEVFPTFFLHALKQLTKFIEEKAHGASALVHTQKWEMEGFKFPLPSSRHEQKAIAKALSDVDALIASLEQLIKKKRHIKQGAMQELLTGKRRLNGFSEEWKEKKLGDECEVITKGTTPTSIGKSFISSGVNFIKVESLKKNGAFIENMFAHIDKDTHNILSRSQLQNKDLLISIAGALGRVGIVNNDILPANTNQALAIVRLKEKSCIYLSYLFYYLNTNAMTKNIELMSSQGAQPNLSLENVYNLPIIYSPNIMEQKAIATILSDMDNELEVLEAKLEKTKQLKEGMMHELLIGRIRLI